MPAERHPEVDFNVEPSEMLTIPGRKPRPTPLDRRSGIPLYHQIQRRLLDQIQSGELKPGDPLPSIQQIASRMGVSQMTVRQAVGALCERGVIYSRQGKGTFISGIKLERDFRQVLSFSEETQGRGATPSSKVLSFRIQTPIREVKEALGLSDEERVFNLRRKNAADATLKAFRKAVAAKDKAAATKLISPLYQALDKAVKTDYFKANTSARLKSRAMASLKKLS